MTAKSDNESFNWVELNVLFQMILISSKIENYELADFMYSIITEKSTNFTLSRDLTLVPNIHLVLGQIFGRQSKFDQALELANKGIEHCKEHHTSFALASLLYIKSISHDALGQKDLAKVFAKKTIMQLIIEDNKTKIEEYKKKLSKSLDVDIEEICQF